MTALIFSLFGRRLSRRVSESDLCVPFARAFDFREKPSLRGFSTDGPKVKRVTFNNWLCTFVFFLLS